MGMDMDAGQVGDPNPQPRARTKHPYGGAAARRCGLARRRGGAEKKCACLTGRPVASFLGETSPFWCTS